MITNMLQMPTAAPQRVDPMDFAPDARERFSNSVEQVIDRALEEANATSKPRDYLGGSRLGLECPRALAYEWFALVAGKQSFFPGRTLRIFRLGHLIEEELVSLLRLAGFDLRNQKEDGSQYGWSTYHGKIRGHIDGVILSAPIPIGLPALWEAKSMNNKKFNECKKRGVAKSHPIYYAQMQTYCAYMQLDDWFFSAYNKDTSELHHEAGKFDPAVAQWASDRGYAVVTAKVPEELPRITGDRNDFRCKLCPHADICWK